MTDDLRATVDSGAIGIVLPKVRTSGDVRSVRKTLRRVEYETGSGSLLILPLLELARGVLAADLIAAASNRVAGLMFGGEDLAVDIGAVRTPAGVELTAARAHIVLASAARGRWAIDSPCMSIRAAALLRRESRMARTLGYVGKLAIHPAQVAIINETFSPSTEEIAMAQQIVDAYRTARERGDGVTRVGDRMVDKPVVKAARETLRQAQRSETPAGAGGLRR